MVIRGYNWADMNDSLRGHVSPGVDYITWSGMTDLPVVRLIRLMPPYKMQSAEPRKWINPIESRT